MGASYRYVLTVRGRTTGRLRSTPVDVIEAAGHRWLVAAYGVSGWVLNARAAGEVTLSRGRSSRRYEVTEPAPPDAVPVLREYITQIEVTRPYFVAAYARQMGTARREAGQRFRLFRLIPRPVAEKQTLCPVTGEATRRLTNRASSG